MKIFSNDYKVNLPTKQHPTKGGTARFSRLFSDLLASKGHKWVGLIDDYYGGRKVKSSFVRGRKNKGWWTVSLPKKYISKNFTLAKSPKNLEKLGADLIDEIKKIIEKESPDIVFINGISCFAWAYLIAAYKMNIPIVVLHAGIWGVEIDLYSDFFTKTGVKIIKKMERDFAKFSTNNIFLNETSRDYFLKNIYKIPKSKIKIIPLPCKDSTSSISKKNRSREINVGIVARWDRIKNHDAFLSLAQEAKKKNLKWNFFSVTTIPDTKKKLEFKKKYRSLINVLPPMSQKELRKFYRKMNFMILPSIFDVSPHVVLEAALEGVPTFISKNVGYAKLFKKNNLGHFIVDFSNPEKALKKIERIKTKKYPIRFTRSLKKLHDPKIVLNRFNELFKEIVA